MDTRTKKSDNILHRVRETCVLFASTSSWIYDKENREQVKKILFNNSVMDLNTFLFDPAKPKIDHKLGVSTYTY